MMRYGARSLTVALFVSISLSFLVPRGACSKLGLLALALFATANSALNLGAADPYAIVAYSTITSAGPSAVIGNIALSPGTSIIGFGPATCSGASEAGTTAAAAAHADADAAYTAAKGLNCSTTLTNAELGGLTLPPVRAFGGFSVFCLGTRFSYRFAS